MGSPRLDPIWLSAVRSLGLRFGGCRRMSRQKTVFCTDSTVGGAQAFGEIGVCDPEDSFRLLRSTFQALQAALPEQALHWRHVSSHTGLLYNEYVDLAAKREAASSFHHPRQKLDMRQWADPSFHIFGLFLQDPDGVYQHGKMEDLPYLLPIFRLQGQPLRILM